MESLDAVDGKGFVLSQFQRCQVQLLQLRLVKHRILKRHPHQPCKPLKPRHDLFHHLQCRLLSGDDNGGEAEVRSAFGPRGQRFQQRGPLRAVGAVDVHNVHFHFLLERLHQCSIASHMPKSGPGACILSSVNKKITKLSGI